MKVPLSVALAYLCDLHDPISVCSDKAIVLSDPRHRGHLHAACACCPGSSLPPQLSST